MRPFVILLSCVAAAFGAVAFAVMCGASGYDVILLAMGGLITIPIAGLAIVLTENRLRKKWPILMFSGVGAGVLCMLFLNQDGDLPTRTSMVIVLTPTVGALIYWVFAWVLFRPKKINIANDKLGAKKIDA